MAKFDLKFNLKHPKDEISEVLIRVNYGNSKTFTMQLKNYDINKVLKTPTQLWDSKLMRPIPFKDIPKHCEKFKANHKLVCAQIDYISAKHNDIIEKARICKIKIDKSYLKQEYCAMFGISPERSRVYVIDILSDFIEGMRNGSILKKDKQRYSYQSTQSYATLLNNLKMWECLNERKLSFVDIDINFYDDFVNFLYNEQECTELDMEKEAYVPDSVGKYIKDLKHLMKYAFEKGISKNNEYDKSYFTVPRGSNFAVSLDSSEIRNLLNLKLEGTDQLIRDVFLVGCYSALRQSDYCKVKKENFSDKVNGDQKVTVLEVKMQKVKGVAVIPVVNDFLTIVQSYDFNMPTIGSVKLNKEIKRIARLAGITQSVTYKSYKGGVEVEVTKKKYEMIASHTARRSAITNFYVDSQLGYEEIMKISGHKNIETLRKYIKISEIKNAFDVGVKLINQINK